MPITDNPDIPLDNKQLRVYDASGKYIRMSVDETIARGQNSWRSWKCSAGTRGLYIDYDGNIWVANCASSHYNDGVHADTTIQAWAKKRLEIFGEFPHIDWYNQNTDGGWPLPKDGWEICEQHVKLQAELRSTELAFFNNLGRSIETIDTTANAWQWKSTLDDVGSVWGLLGNIRDGFDVPDDWVTCPYGNCGCGADVILSKSKTYAHRELLDVTKNGSRGTANVKNFTDQISDSVAVEMNFPIDFQVLWDLGRKCNYNCNYCWPSVHSNTEKFADYDTIIRAIDMITTHWAEGKQIRWNFGGGEPTMHPQFIDILKYLKSKGQWILITTNGSRSTKFWTEAAQYCNSINMSAHFASMDLYPGNEQRFIDNCEVIMKQHDLVDDDHWIEIKLMTPPGYLERAQATKDRIMALNMLDQPGANGRPKGSISLVPIRSLDDSSSLVNYSENEIEYFRNQ
jgi:organic radical activating enzyme